MPETSGGVGGVGYVQAEDVGRRLRHSYLLAEAVVNIPIVTLLGLSATETDVDTKAAFVCCRFLKDRKALRSLPAVTVKHTLFPPLKGADAVGLSDRGRGHEIKIALTYRFEVNVTLPLRFGTLPLTASPGLITQHQDIGGKGATPSCMPKISTEHERAGMSLLPLMETPATSSTSAIRSLQRQQYDGK